MKKYKYLKSVLMSFFIFTIFFICSEVKVQAMTNTDPQLGSVLKEVQVGEQVKAIDSRYGWWLIAENGKLAWCNAGPTSYWDKNTGNFPILLRINQKMNIHEAQVVYNYKKGQIIQVINGSVTGWWKVKTPDGYYGWVNSANTSRNSSGKLIASSNVGAYFTADIAPLQQIKVVQPGEQIKAIDSRTGWWMIAENDRLGWISAGPTSYWDNNTSTFPLLLKANSKLAVNEVGIIYNYSKGEKITVVEGSVAGWWKVKTPNGYYGWINAKPTHYDSNKNLIASENLPVYFSGKEPSNSNEQLSKQQLVLREAYKHLGKPYVTAGKGPDAFDCSGFTSYVYRHALGIEIGGWTGAQINSGREVSRADLQPGDLVFPHSNHVGIYVGNGQMIHAPQSGDVVKVAPIYKFWRARRIIN
ncbi:SH3 domain-containing C40 family peptidase [Clostridium sporogenes]|uniref:SH3 domain-containing C40 family peptidase n=1 Tax=Clostridium sporogenes TaxID=1509 RepID=UPI0013D7E105|nr:SH3 domain-containing C40 family peptidase [Clostridium sporogenes]MCW6123179.1 C40 family peptidase [Clostridium sporogenes]NFT28633.1 NlpC/P60 family protein [Clostridium sporogenes]